MGETEHGIETTKTHATGRIEVARYEPRPYDEPSPGPELVEIDVREKFVGDIEGEGVVRFLQAQRQDGSASFVGIERVSGRIGDRRGTFLLQDAGTVSGTTVTGGWSVIPGSGTGGLQGLRGDGGFTAELGQNATITLDYWFE
jgi:Protein of unknown function (DUF3224)